MPAYICFQARRCTVSQRAQLQWFAYLALVLTAWNDQVIASVPVNVGINAASPVRVVPETALALHTSVYDNQHGNGQLDNRLIEAGVEMLRYPGGSYSDIYHWSISPTMPYYACCNFGLPDVTQPHPVTPDKGADPAVDPPGNAFPFAYVAADSHFGNFIGLLDASGTKAMVTVNYGSSLGNFDQTLHMGVDCAIHWPIEVLSGLHPPVEDPSPARALFDLSVWRLRLPGHVPPQNWFMRRNALPNRSRIEAIVEEYNQRSAPVSSD